jgi:hypothetical protein
MIPLTRHQEGLLRGRSPEVSDIAENCRQRRLTVVTANPGIGVTSLIEAGVRPVLEREGFLIFVFREWTGKSFVTDLKEKFAGAVREQTEMNAPPDGSLGVMLREIRERSGKPVAVLFDQFEDYLRCHSRTSLAEDFDIELAEAIQARDAAFVIGMQTHALGAFERLKQHVPNLLANHTRLDLLSRDVAREIVECEARFRLLEVTPEVMEALVTAPVALRNNDRVHPFFLKIAIAHLLDAASRLKAPFVEMPLIEVRGGVDRIVMESLDPTIAELNPTHLELFFRWGNILISPDKKRVAVTEKGLTDFAGKLNKFAMTLLPILTDGMHILRRVEIAGTARYEIAREGLTTLVRDWWERREAIIQSRNKARFRARTLSIALASLVLMYVVYIVLSWKDPS